MDQVAAVLENLAELIVRLCVFSKVLSLILTD